MSGSGSGVHVVFFITSHLKGRQALNAMPMAVFSVKNWWNCCSLPVHQGTNSVGLLQCGEMFKHASIAASEVGVELDLSRSLPRKIAHLSLSFTGLCGKRGRFRPTLSGVSFLLVT